MILEILDRTEAIGTPTKHFYKIYAEKSMFIPLHHFENCIFDIDNSHKYCYHKNVFILLTKSERDNK